jgi:hydroxymethylbilane synthase
LWPLNSSDVDWFQRETISAKIPDGQAALWIAKADALSNESVVAQSGIVWASGIETWRRLARRGIWVNGCAESLGEQEDPNIETLTGSELNWLKLTHEQGYAEGSMPILATYRLVPKDGRVDLEGKKYFFWKSGSTFEHALSQNPWLKEMTHFCGPGNTKRIVERHGVELNVFLGHAQWLAEMSEH